MSVERLSGKKTKLLPRAQNELEPEELCEVGVAAEAPVEDPDGREVTQKLDKRKVANDMRTSILARSRREQIRAGLPNGFYICISGKRSVRRCYLLPDVDYWRYSYEGTAFPPKASFDVVCTLCAKKGVGQSTESGSSQVSSSTSGNELQ